MPLNYVAKRLRWIPVSEGVPSKSEECLVITWWGVVKLASYDSAAWNVPDGIKADSLTHWAYIEVPTAAEREAVHGVD